MIYKSLFNVANIIKKLYICTYMINVYTYVICTVGYVKLCRDIYIYNVADIMLYIILIKFAFELYKYL